MMNSQIKTWKCRYKIWRIW